MRSPVYESRVIYRDAEEVVAAIKAKAERESLTFSELMRRAARRELAQAA
jgi:hypothetical protein